MALNSNDIAVLADEVAAGAVGGRVQKIRDGREGEVTIELRVPGRSVRILLAAGDVHARVLIASMEGQRRPTPTPFVQLLRKRLTGGRLVAVGVREGDRVAELAFAARTPEGEASTWRIVAELTGRHGNLLLVDEGGLVGGSLRANVSHRRGLVPGAPYIPPSQPPEHLALAPTALCVGSASAAVERRIEADIVAREAETARTRLLGELRRVRKRLRRRLAQIEGDAERAERADEYQRLGELLQSAWGQVPPGAQEALVPDYYEPGTPTVSVPLDPSRSLSDNVARYFKQAKRLKGARARIAERRAETESELAAIDAAIARVGPEEGPAAVQALRRELVLEGRLPSRAPASRAARQRPERTLPYWTFTSRTGLPILVGKSARDNDRLTLHVARGRDLWLHVDGAAGSHVVVRLDKGAQIDGESLLDAAALAVHYSKRREDTGVEVRYTARKYVNKPKGAAPGMVTIAGAKTVFVKRDPARVKRLFESRG